MKKFGEERSGDKQKPMMEVDSISCQDCANWLIEIRER